MTLFLQDPFEADPTYLDEAIFEACKEARSGGASFAFASAAGAKLLLEDKTFNTFAAASTFDLIVGVDAVTNTAALGAITNAQKNVKGMSTSVFLNERRDALFHPKFCWFRHRRGGVLIVGSGNLTVGGLRGNWEAFSATKLDATQMDSIESRWSSWKYAHSTSLLPTTDSRVLSRAAKNTGWVNFLLPEKGKSGKGSDSKAADDVSVGSIHDNNSVLVAEIPRGGDRWTSAGFDLDSYTGFFGAKIGTQRRIVLQHVAANGSLGELESRPSLAVKSRNYRFELGAASGLAYPDSGVPIAVFVKVAPRMFRYRLLMPGQRGYGVITKLLDTRWTGRSNSMRRVLMTVTELREAWAESPLWLPD